jgi:hypothetical protein
MKIRTTELVVLLVSALFAGGILFMVFKNYQNTVTTIRKAEVVCVQELIKSGFSDITFTGATFTPVHDQNTGVSHPNCILFNVTARTNGVPRDFSVVYSDGVILFRMPYFSTRRVP